MSISNDVKDRIIESVDLVDLIGEVVDLRKKGGNYSGLCPFHNEKTPSFMVSPDKNIYKCFGCGKSGNAISFMCDYHGLTYPDALKELGRRVGIQVEEPTPKMKEQLSKKDAAMLALDMTKEYYTKQLHTAQGKIASSYFRKRSFSTETLKTFSLGYAPDLWDGLLNLLKKQKFTEEIMLDAGLIIKNENKDSYYDRFRNRAIFPIQNFMGKVIGFGARQLTEDKDQPKYINSPQSIVYDKSHTLYGIYHAKNEIRSKRATILVEGYVDVITSYQAGFKNVVASSGTSLTKEQLNILSKLCNRIYFVYDADSAGVHATERGLEMALEKGFDVLIVSLPSGEDPDSLINNHGASVFQSYLNEAVSFLDYLVEKMEAEGKFSSPSLKSESIRFLLNIISKIPDRLQHDDYISRMASKLKMSDSQITRIYQEKRKIETSQSNKSDRANVSSSGIVETPENKAIIPEITEKNEPIENIMKIEEIMLFTIALKSDELFDLVMKKVKVRSNHLISSTAIKLIQYFETVAKRPENYLNLIFSDDELPKEISHIISELAFKGDEKSTNWSRFVKVQEDINYPKIIKDLVYKLEFLKIETIIDELTRNVSIKPFEEQIADLKKISELNTKKIKLVDAIKSISKE